MGGAAKPNKAVEVVHLTAVSSLVRSQMEVPLAK